MSNGGKRPRLTEYGCTNEGCYNMGGWEFVDLEGDVPKGCPRCGSPMEPMQLWAPAAEVELLRTAADDAFGILNDTDFSHSAARTIAKRVLHPAKESE